MGICGSRILRANGHLRKEMLKKSGREGVAAAFTLVEWQEGDQRQVVAITQQDVVEIQFAKGATRVGAEVRLEEAGLTASELDEVIIAGVLGNYLDPLPKWTNLQAAN